MTRPLGASFADWMGKSRHAGGLGLGDGPVALVLGLLIAGLVGYLTVTGSGPGAINCEDRERGSYPSRLAKSPSWSAPDLPVRPERSHGHEVGSRALGDAVDLAADLSEAVLHRVDVHVRLSANEGVTL